MELIDTIDFCYIPLFKDKFFLRQKYVEERLTAQEIADQISSAKSTVLKHLKRYGIPVREINPGVRQRHFVAYGQKMQQRGVVTHLREQEYIAKMRELRSQGFTYEQIAQALNSLGIPTKTHKGRWHRKTVNAILNQEI